MKVLLADNQTMVRQGLRLLLERAGDFEIAEASSPDEAIPASSDADVVVIAFGERGTRTDELVHKLRAKTPDARVLVLSSVERPMEVHAVFAAGAQGYMLKSASGEELAEAVRTVAAGGGYLQPALGASLARWRESAGSPDGEGPALSARQQQVLPMIALGHTNAEIAEMLGVSLRTVEAHRGNIMRRLGIRTRAELVRYAADARLIDISVD